MGRTPKFEKTHQMMLRIPESKYQEIVKAAQDKGITHNMYFVLLGLKAFEQEKKRLNDFNRLLIFFKFKEIRP